MIHKLLSSYNFESHNIQTTETKFYDQHQRITWEKNMVDATSLVIQTLYRSILMDPYPDLKRGGCDVLILLSELIPKVVQMHMEVLLKSLCGDFTETSIKKNAFIPLLRHRHAKTRLLALQTSATLIQCYSPSIQSDDKQTQLITEKVISTYIIPGWDHCSFDKSVPVRATLMKVVGKLLRLFIHDNSSKISHTTSKLLIFLLHGISSQSHDISYAAKNEIEQVATEYLKLSNYNKEPALLTMIQDFLPIISPLLFEYVMDWSLQRKLQGLDSLQSSLKILISSKKCHQSSQTDNNSRQNAIISSADIHNIVNSICFAFIDDNVTVQKLASSCAKILGTDTSTIKLVCDIALPRIYGDTQNPTSEKSTNKPLSKKEQLFSALSLIGNLLAGENELDLHNDCELAKDIAVAIASTSILDHFDDCDMMWALYNCCKSLVDIFQPSSFDQEIENLNIQSLIILNILRCIVQMLASPEDFELKTDVLDILKLLGTKDSTNEKGGLFGKYFRNLISVIFPNGPDKCHIYLNQEVSEGSTITTAFHAFTALLEHTDGGTIGKNFDLIIPIFTNCLIAPLPGMQVENEIISIHNYENKIQVMALLESTISDPTLPCHLLQPYAVQLINSTIVPNLHWRAGGKAAALRKLSTAVLFSLLRANAVPPPSLFETFPHIVPIMKTNISDDDTSTRQLTCLSFAMILKSLPAQLSEDTVVSLYPSLLKCIDDCDENVRFAGCALISIFFEAAPPSHFQCGVYDNIVEQLLIHMDDPDPKMQQAILDVLRSSMKINKKTLIKKVQDAKLCHRSSQYCDILLNEASKKR